MCGGSLTILDTSTVCECDYCGSKQTVPQLDDEKKINLYSRANRLRLNNEFDKAAGIYESIVSEYQNEAEAFWGLVLCKYGIEYVNDPSGEMIPTCHRLSYDVVTDDNDYKNAMYYADDNAKYVYYNQAMQIENIRRGVIAVSNNEKPYDIFICYKETDSNGNRTVDSVIAQDVYNELIKNNYKVFFSRITLEDKLGVEFEPYIFAALNSSKVMLAFGTSYENYEAVWVKNEWSRFLKLMAQKGDKYLIPCYKGIDAYDLPKEFAKFQAQDMGKVGAIQDLLRGIDKILQHVKNEKIENATKSNGLSELDRWVSNGQTFLGLDNFAQAKDLYNEMSKRYPEDYRGWWGLILSDSQKLLKNDLAKENQYNIWFGYVKKLAPPEAFAEINSKYVEYLKGNAYLAAKDELDSLNKSITKEQTEIKKINDEINSIKEKNNWMCNSHYSQIQAERKRISECEKRINNIKGDKSGCIITFVLGVIATIVGVILFKNSHYVWGMIAFCGSFGFIGEALMTDKEYNGTYNKYGNYRKKEEKGYANAIKSENASIQQANNRIAELQNMNNKILQDQNNEINRMNFNIADHNKMIMNIQSYMQLGINRISLYWFSEKCKKIDVEQAGDEEVAALRKQIVSK